MGKRGIKTREVPPEAVNHYLKTGCSGPELQRMFGISYGDAIKSINAALKKAKEDYPINAMIDKIELSEQENEI